MKFLSHSLRISKKSRDSRFLVNCRVVGVVSLRIFIIFWVISVFSAAAAKPVPVSSDHSDYKSFKIPPAASSGTNALGLPLPGEMVFSGTEFSPVIIRGLIVDPGNPLRLDFVIDTGDDNIDSKGKSFKREISKLIKYFLAALTVPEDEFWVNLSPYEKNRIIPDSLGVTDMGKGLLAQDYLLKQLTSSLMYPEKKPGNEFWQRVHGQIKKKYGNFNVPVNTFRKVWIVPDKASVYEDGGMAFVGERHLRVMLENDYLALAKAQGYETAPAADTGETTAIFSAIVREIIIPELEKEVNQGKTFADLRQIFNAMILATWFKKRFHEGFLGSVYMDKNKVGGIDLSDKKMKQKIYNRYIEAFTRGVFDYIKIEQDGDSRRKIRRRYFSGGISRGVVRVDSLRVEPLAGEPVARQESIFAPESRRGYNILAGVDLVGSSSPVNKKKGGISYGNSYFFQNPSRTVEEALRDGKGTRAFLAKAKGAFLYHLGASGYLRRLERMKRPRIKRTANGAIIIFKTPLREIVVAVNEARGIVKSVIRVRWDILRSKQPQASAVYDGVTHRKNENLFNAWKNGFFLSQFVADWLGADSAANDDFLDKESREVVINRRRQILGESAPVLDVTISASKVIPPEDYSPGADSTVYVLVKNDRGELGMVRELLPAAWDESGLHFTVSGFQRRLSVEEVFSFQEERPVSWQMKTGGKPVIEATGDARPLPRKEIAPILDGDDHLVAKIEAAPIARGSSLSERIFRYRLGIPTVFTEMVLIGQLCVPKGYSARQTSASLHGIDGFYKMRLSDREKNTVFQAIGPHNIFDYELFKTQFGSDGLTVKTYIRAAHIAKKIGFREFNINMCCPALIHCRAGGGAGMTERPELIAAVVAAIKKAVPDMVVSAKILLPSIAADNNQPSKDRAIEVMRLLEKAGIDRLIVQAQTRAFAGMYPEIVKAMAAISNIPVSYNGNVAVLNEADLDRLGIDDGATYSIEGLSELFAGTKADRVMVGRILLGSPWLLAGKEYSDGEIVKMTLEQACYMKDDFHGMGKAGSFLMKIGLLNYISRIKSPDKRLMLEKSVRAAEAPGEIVAALTAASSPIRKEKFETSPAKTGFSPPARNLGGIDLNQGLVSGLIGASSKQKLAIASFVSSINQNNKKIDGFYPVIIGISTFDVYEYIKITRK